MKITVLTNEYPPHIYGGAGVHVEYLTKEFVALNAGEIQVLSFGDQDVHEGSLRVEGVEAGAKLEAQDPRHAKVLDTLQRYFHTDSTPVLVAIMKKSGDLMQEFCRGMVVPNDWPMKANQLIR